MSGKPKVPLSLMSDETYRKMAWITGVGLKEVLEKEMSSDNKPEPVVVASLNYGCGRAYLDVSEIVVAMQGDPCRHILPSDVAQEIPKDELERSMIGDQKATDIPLEVVRLFRGQAWDEKAIAWAAETINADVQKRITAAVAKREAEIVALCEAMLRAYATEYAGSEASGALEEIAEELPKQLLQNGGGA